MAIGICSFIISGFGSYNYGLAKRRRHMSLKRKVKLIAALVFSLMGQTFIALVLGLIGAGVLLWDMYQKWF
jgi:hypothetical protein